MTLIGAVCCHKRPHEVRLQGGKTRASSPYPRELIMLLLEVLSAQLRDHGRLGDTLSQAEAEKYLDAVAADACRRRIREKGAHRRSVGDFAKWVEIGVARIRHLRHGNRSSESLEFDETGSVSSAPPGSPAGIEPVTDVQQMERKLVSSLLWQDRI